MNRKYYNKLVNQEYYQIPVMKTYIITFRNGTDYDHKYTVVKARDKDDAYSKALCEYGFMNVSGVHVDDEYAREKLRMKGFKPIQK